MPSPKLPMLSNTTFNTSAMYDLALAKSSPLAEPSRPLSGSAASLPSCLITRHGWVARDTYGRFLTLAGQTTTEPDDAWVALDPHEAARKLRCTALDLSRWRLVPVLLQALASDPQRRWRIAPQ